MTKPEYDVRRKALLDGATTLSTSSDDPPTAVTHQENSVTSTAKSALPTGNGKASVFARLGSAASTGGGTAEGQWDHSGYEALYGKQNKKQTAGLGVAKTISKKTASKPTSLSQRFSEIYRPPKSDLRTILNAKGGPSNGGSKRALPAKCPW